MHLIMDLVVNHCSDKHEWFQKALADPDGPYAGYFISAKEKTARHQAITAPNFGGPAWTKVPGTNKYYLHTFAKEQPDLNWENPVVRKKIYEMINWWFEKAFPVSVSMPSSISRKILIFHPSRRTVMTDLSPAIKC